jgi:mRNA-degrading endonuclease RelE of RelBE toxin-antitoxin system
MKILYKPRFLKAFNKLSPSLQDEIEEKINLFKEDQFHSFLKTHKLKGVMNLILQ